MSERWDRSSGETKRTERPDVDAFLEEIIAVCERHGFSISHEDGHGGFIIEERDEGNFDWLRGAEVTAPRRALPGEPL